MEPLSTGQLVWLPECRVESRVEGEVAPRSYAVSTPQGHTRHNRRDLIPLPTQSTTSREAPLEIGTSTPSNSNATSEQSLHKGNQVSHPPFRLISDPNWN